MPPEISMGNIEFRDVNFSYAGRSDAKILNNCSLSVLELKCCYCGTSGSGKSTISSLLTRLYDVDGDDDRSGIFIDAQISRISRYNVALQNWDCVSRTLLFATSIIENIRFGCPSASTGRNHQETKLANAHEFILSFPMPTRLT